MNRKNIILIGMPGVGKSSAGVVLAKVLGYKFADSDLIIQEKLGMLLSEIISEKGIEGFIQTENNVNKSLNMEDTVIATGGSVIYGQEAMEHLKEIGTVVYLKVSYKDIKARLGDLKHRGVVVKEGQSLRELYDERAPLYEKYADITVEEKGQSIRETVLMIEKLLKQDSQI